MEKYELVKILWNYLYLGEPIEKCDCILGMGCHDLNIPERCAELYKNGYADIIIFTGGLGKVTKELWNKSEAEKFAEIAISLGVPKEKIYVEKESTNTGENFEFTKKLIQQNHLNINSFLLVHKPYMERRAMAAFKVFLPDKKCFITSPKISFDEYFKDEALAEENIQVLVGDLQRIKVYAECGFQIKQEIPDEVWKAYCQLVKLGYDKYVIKT